MGKTVNVPGRLLALVGIGIMVLVVSMLLLPKVQVKPEDPTCPSLYSLASRFDANTSTLTLASKAMGLTNPKIGTLSVGAQKKGAEEKVTCRKGTKVGENVNYNYCENLIITGALVDERGNIIKSVNRRATLVVDKNGKFIRSFCP